MGFSFSFSFFILFILYFDALDGDQAGHFVERAQRIYHGGSPKPPIVLKALETSWNDADVISPVDFHSHSQRFSVTQEARWLSSIYHNCHPICTEQHSKRGHLKLQTVPELQPAHNERAWRMRE